MTRDRDPFPFPKYENDDTLTRSKTCQKQVFTKPTHIAQTEDPWRRLNDNSTFSSMRRSVLYHNETPKDSLDFHLSAVYDNHLDFLLNKNEILFQEDTLTGDRRDNKDDAPKDDDHMKIRMWVNPQKVSIYSIKGAIGFVENLKRGECFILNPDGAPYSVIPHTLNSEMRTSMMEMISAKYGDV